jgi:antitoxin component YwqK of YwqJK toxin-antitoxin module
MAKARKVKAGKSRRTPRKVLHKNGSLWATGFMNGDVMDGPWKWFRKDGTLMRSGSFDNGIQVGDWVTHDKNRRVVKVTRMTGTPTQHT